MRLALLALIAASMLAPSTTRAEAPWSSQDEVRVQFQAKSEGEQFTFILDDEGVEHSVPCEVVLAPGLHQVAVRGVATFKNAIQIPSSPQATVTIVRRDRKLLVMGIVGSGVGFLAGMAGNVLTIVSLFASASGDACKPEQPCGNLKLSIYWSVIPWAVEIVGAALAVTGFVFSGRDRLMVGPALSSSRLRLEGFAVAPLERGAMAAVRFSF